MNNSPLIDTNTLWAINTLFAKRKVVDPWAQILMGHFANMFVYSEELRFTVPCPNITSCNPLQSIPLLEIGHKYDNNFFKPVFLEAPEPVRVADNYVFECFENFSDYAIANRKRLKYWLATHMIPEIWQGWAEHLKRNFVFDVDIISSSKKIDNLCTRLDINEKSILYAFDNILRFPEYGKLAGPDEYYLNHPLRDAFLLPTSTVEPALPPNVPVSWSNSVLRLSAKLNLDEFIAFLYELRFQVHENRLHKIHRTDQVDPDIVRLIAEKVGIPPRLKYHGLRTSILTGILTCLAVFLLLAICQLWLEALSRYQLHCGKDIFLEVLLKYAGLSGL